jgi:hypothetical protein
MNSERARSDLVIMDAIGRVLRRVSVEDPSIFPAFRIMDMITDMAPETGNLRSVYKVEATASGSSSQMTFFSVGIDVGFIVLQFNDPFTLHSRT